MPTVNEIKIEAGVAPQPETRGVRGTRMYPWAEMKPGESVFYPSTEDEPRPWKTKTTMTAALNRRFGPDGWRFITRKHINEDGTLGARIFRVE